MGKTSKNEKKKNPNLEREHSTIFGFSVNVRKTHSQRSVLDVGVLFVEDSANAKYESYPENQISYAIFPEINTQFKVFWEFNKPPVDTPLRKIAYSMIADYVSLFNKANSYDIPIDQLPEIQAFEEFYKLPTDLV